MTHIWQWVKLDLLFLRSIFAKNGVYYFIISNSESPRPFITITIYLKWGPPFLKLPILPFFD